MSPNTQQYGEIEDGQFDDAIEEAAEVSTSTDPRGGHHFIDEDTILDSSNSEEDDDKQDAFEAEEDDLEAAAFHTLRAEDEDWEIAERGALRFTYTVTCRTNGPSRFHKAI